MKEYGSRVLGFSFYVKKATEFTGKPVKHTVANNFDYMADLFSLRRIDGESNVDYRNRIWNARVHPGSPTYVGTINNLSRDFGIFREKTVTIDVKTDGNGDVIAESPRVDILTNRIVLYKDWRPNVDPVIDKEIRIYSRSDEGYYLSDLVSEINSSECFSATVFSGIRPNMRSTNLMRQSTFFRVVNDGISADYRTQLVGTYIIKDSVDFSERDIFTTEVSSEPTQPGEYSVDYTKGTVRNHTAPDGSGTVSYCCNVFPLEVDSTPIEIYTFQDDDYQNELFEKKILDSGEEQNGLPNNEGSRTYHQLFLETQVFWGK